MHPGGVSKLGLELNQKTNIFPLRNGIDFCGFHLYLTQTGKVVKKLRYSSVKRIKRRIRRWEKDYAAGTISREKIEECFRSWRPMQSMGHGNAPKEHAGKADAAMARAKSAGRR